MSKPSVEKRLSKVKSFTNQGRILDAIYMCEKILAEFPQNKRAKLMLSSILLKNNRQTITQDFLISLYNGEAFYSIVEIGNLISEKIPNSIFLWKIIGVSAAQIRQFDLASNAFHKILQLDSKDFEAHFNLGNILVSQNQKSEAIEEYKTAIILNPKYGRAYNNLGSVYFEQNKHEMAIKAFKKAISVEPMFNEPFHNLNRIWEQINQHNKKLLSDEQIIIWLNHYMEIGQIFAENDNLDMAVQTFHKTIEIDPLSATNYSNLGTALYQQGEFSKAESVLSKSISFDEKIANAHNSLGLVKKELGKLSEAIHELSVAWNLDDKSIIFAENFADLFVQSYSRQSDDFSSLEYSETLNKLNEIKSPKMLIYLSILAFMNRDFTLCRQRISDFEKIYESSDTKLNAKDHIFCSAFHALLDKLSKNFNDKSVEEISDKIFHIGDSHCLSFSHRSLWLKGKLFQIQPKITFGAKAYHLGLVSHNKYKAMIKRHFTSIPKNSKILVSFGEIDCRHNEGLIPASTKLNLSIKELAKSTVENYLNWFDKVTSGSNHELYFINVPAPVKRKELSDHDNDLLANTVKIFNQQLKTSIQNYRFNLINVYGLTVTDSYFSNKKFHIDNVHLGDGILAEIQDLLT